MVNISSVVLSTNKPHFYVLEMGFRVQKVNFLETRLVTAFWISGNTDQGYAIVTLHAAILSHDRANFVTAVQ